MKWFMELSLGGVSYRGKKKKHRAEVIFSVTGRNYFFIIEKPDNSYYNSQSEGIAFLKPWDAQNAAEAYINLECS